MAVVSHCMSATHTYCNSCDFSLLRLVHLEPWLRCGHCLASHCSYSCFSLLILYSESVYVYVDGAWGLLSPPVARFMTDLLTRKDKYLNFKGCGKLKGIGPSGTGELGSFYG